ncbi:hypothetical protein [Haloarcula marina]|uniref:hypothetical protein n=1 Tax=Haloarcula marina TaxID=2961574 RepID=UPI0020B6EA5C|nr:hypothetical protein [Halomicroarcula marina]
MLRAVLRRLRSTLRRGDRGDAEDGDDGFAGSRLDASVNQSHGESGQTAAREMDEIQERAQTLSQADQRRR